ncbi:MAG: PD-(D/E)XK nuclease family protein [Anaerovibrio sp.]|uniref:PD-(D/E)XK nuclease family protein n=1 Tax=Anaerovibrio sp. TaxID=1872532 RepID=UPI0025E83FD3|nr:PD-(D/E)XK nuclease family protein [Anaerovibrio sp.]MCR5176861.1 PD-(D/E)XK nuclease family protein [Anaerovibrio sp.]
MANKITCSLCTVFEHDMDVMFMQGLLSDNGFLALFLSKTDWHNKGLKPIHGELSNTDADLGETDIMIMLTDGTKKYTLLIEDKIDAVAQPEQYQRYIKRGDKGVAAGEYSDYRIFIVCPEKYYQFDNEAKNYKYYVTYEECAEYFKIKDNAMSNLRYQEIMQALEKTKRPSQVTVIDEANKFFKQYCDYQKANYPTLDIRTKDTSNGYWVEYRTAFPYERINLIHKMPNGYVDLVFARSKENIAKLEYICEWLNSHGMPGISAHPTGKSTVLRINVPALHYETGFTNVPKENIDNCFHAISKMVEIAKLLNSIQSFLEK